MANLAIVGTHSTNGVAAIHSELLRTTTGQGLRRDVPRALQQQDQRRHAAALAAAGEPALARPDHRGDRRRLDHRPRPAAQAHAAGRRRGFPRRLPPGQARAAKAALRRLAQGDDRPDGRPGHALRLPDQAHPRVQAAAAQRPAHRGALQPPAGRTRARRAPADVLLRRQGGPGLPAGQAHHQAHQQRGRDDRRRPGQRAAG